MKKLYWIIPMVAFVSCQPEEKTSAGPAESAPAEEISEEPVVEEPVVEEPVVEEEPAPDQEEPEASFDVSDANSLVGQSFGKVEPALKAAEISYRVVERDGESFPITEDFRPERLNFKISDGIITAVDKY
jgi:hypothetical protein